MLKTSISVFIFIIVCSISIFLYIFYKPVNIDEEDKENDKIKTTITGAVASPGIYYVDPKKTLKLLIFEAGGLEDYANINDIDFNLILKPNTEYEIGMDESRIVKKNINSLVTSSSLKSIVKTYLITDKIANSIVNYIKRFGEYDSWTEIDNIEGVGEKTLKELQKFFFII